MPWWGEECLVSQRPLLSGGDSCKAEGYQRIPCACVGGFGCDRRVVRVADGKTGGVFVITGVRSILDWLMKKAHFDDIDKSHFLHF